MDFMAIVKKYAYFITAGAVVLVLVLIGWLVVGSLQAGNEERTRELEALTQTLSRQNMRGERPDPQWVKRAEEVVGRVDESLGAVVREIEKESSAWLKYVYTDLQAVTPAVRFSTFKDMYGNARESIVSMSAGEPAQLPMGPPSPEEVKGVGPDQRTGTGPMGGPGWDSFEPGPTFRRPGGGDGRQDQFQTIPFWDFQKDAAPEDRHVASLEMGVVRMVTEVLGRMGPQSTTENQLPEVVRLVTLTTDPGARISAQAGPTGRGGPGDAGSTDRTDGSGKAFLAGAVLTPELKNVNVGEFANEQNPEQRRGAILTKLAEVQPVVFHRVGVNFVIEVRTRSLEKVLEALRLDSSLMLNYEEIRLQTTVDPFNPGVSTTYTAYPGEGVVRVYVKASAYRILDCRERPDNRFRNESMAALAQILSAKAEVMSARQGTGADPGRPFQ